MHFVASEFYRYNSTHLTNIILFVLREELEFQWRSTLVTLTLASEGTSDVACYLLIDRQTMMLTYCVF